MVKALLNVLINLIATIIQIVCWPVNSLISAALPDMSNKILSITNTFNSVFDSITWSIGLIPAPIIEVLLFVLLVEVAKHTIFVSTHVLVKVWNVFQKIKFW
jgi:hypothetical protein